MLPEYWIRQYTTLFFQQRKVFLVETSEFLSVIDVYCNTPLYQPVMAVGGMVQND